MKRVLIAIPAFNEEASLPGVAASLGRLYPDWERLLINDGSTDRTREAAEAAGLRSLNLVSNLGIGGAVQAGFRYAARHRFDVMVQFDGDDQHPADRIGDLVRLLDETGGDIVVGSRFLEHKGYASEPLRVPGIFILSRLISVILGAPITDPTSGFRAYGPRAIRLFAEQYPQHYPEPESLVTAGRAGLKIIELPVCMKQRAGGVSSIGFARGLHYMFTVVVNILLETLSKRRPLPC